MRLGRRMLDTAASGQKTAFTVPFTVVRRFPRGSSLTLRFPHKHPFGHNSERRAELIQIICMSAWLRNVNITILVSHVSWNVLTSSTLLAQPCICTIALNGHAPISNLHHQFLCCCALLQVKISLKTLPSYYLSQFLSFTPTKSE